MALTQQDILYFIITDRFYGEPDKTVKTDLNNPKAFHGGNFEGIVSKIPYLKKLGITALWITPVYLQVPEDNNGLYGYHGYWTLDFNAVDPCLYVDKSKYQAGSKLYLKDLVTILHKNGIKLVLDMVVNHTGYRHPALTDKENPTPIRSDWFNSFYIGVENDEIQGQLAGLPDMDLDKSEVSDYHIQTILSWIKETGIDAIRMDTAKHVEKIFWNDFKTHVKGKYPDVSLLGEVLLFTIEEVSKYQQHFAFDSLFDFPLQRAIENVFAYNDTLETFVSPFSKGTGILEKDNAYTNHNRLVTLLDNHDLSARFYTTVLRAFGQNREAATRVYMLSLSFLFTIRGIPQIYYGNEMGMEGGADPDNRRDFEWHRLDKNYEIIPDFRDEKLIYDHTRQLIKIRKENDALTTGSFICLYVDYFLLVYLRHHNENVVITVIHNGWQKGQQPCKISYDQNPVIPARIKNLLEGKTLKCKLTGNQSIISSCSFEIWPDWKSAMILTLD
ncbi:MAG: alpha-amylase family glycosyl hydrolase [Bacteroidales bacterium]